MIEAWTPICQHCSVEGCSNVPLSQSRSISLTWWNGETFLLSIFHFPLLIFTSFLKQPQCCWLMERLQSKSCPLITWDDISPPFPYHTELWVSSRWSPLIPVHIFITAENQKVLCFSRNSKQSEFHCSLEMLFCNETGIGRAKFLHCLGNSECPPVFEAKMC